MKSLNKEVKFEVGDKVIYVHDGTVWEVTKKITKGNTHIDIIRDGSELTYIIHRNQLRHATSEEVVEKKMLYEQKAAKIKALKGRK